MKKYLLGLILITLVTSKNYAQFTLLTDKLKGLRDGDATWTDIDSDGDIDLIIFGSDINAIGFSKFFRNDELVFKELDIPAFPKLFDGSIDWADYNNDGRLDLALIAYSIEAQGVISKIYSFSNGNFTESGIILPGVTRGSIDWGDFNNDGNIDLLIVGQNSESNSITKLFKNKGDGFEEVALLGVTGVSFGDAAWADFNSDGFLDFIITGVTGIAPNNGPSITKLYKNTGSQFEEVINNFPGLIYSSVNWGDADNDGDLDLLLTGFTANTESLTQLYINQGTHFQLIETNLPGVHEGFAKWGDYDNDGDLDILLVGNRVGSFPIFKVFSNEGLIFEEIFDGPGVGQASGGWADFNNDGFLDIFINGQNEDFDLVASIYLNDGGTGGRIAGNKSANQPPSTPTNLSATTSGNSVWLSWARSIDDLTAQASLSYNVSITRDDKIVIPSFSSVGGSRSLVEAGNAGLMPNFKANGLALGEYEWTVQSIDNSFSASSFASTGNFTIDGVVVGIFQDFETDIMIFPNPVKDYLNVMSGNKTVLNFKLLDSRGIELKQGTHEGRVSLEDLVNGVYFLQIYTGKRIITKLIIKQ